MAGNASLNRALVQRQGGGAPAAQADPNGPTPESRQKEQDDRERTARDALAARAGQPAATIWFSNPLSSSFTPEDKETLNLGEVAPRTRADPPRLAFDQAGPAAAYASLLGGSGSVVIQEGGFYFIVRLAQGKHAFTNDKVYQVALEGSGVVNAISSNGYTFISGSYEPDAGRAELKGRDSSYIDEKEKRDTSTGQATVPSAKDLRALAGIDLNADKPGQADTIKPDNSIGISVEQGETFVRNYMQARALEALAQNETMAYSLEGTFKPDASKEGPNKSSDSAQVMINSARMIAGQYRGILDNERKLEEEHNQLTNTKSKESAGYFMTYSRNGKTERKNILDWIDDVQADQTKIADQKNAILASSPLVAQMVETQAPRSDFDVAVSHAASTLWSVATTINPVAWLADKAYKKLSGPDNPVDRSALGGPQTPAGDEEIRAGFQKRLDAVLKAIHKTRARAASGDADFLFSLEGLQARVASDLAGLKGRNQFLSSIFERLRKEHQAAQEKEEYVEAGVQIVVQIGALFFPPLQFLSAALGFALQAQKMGQHMNEWEASQAALDPSKALADQQKATEQLASDTFWMAVQAVDLATSANAALHGVETSGKVPSFNPAKPLAAADREAESAKVISSLATSTGEIKVTKGGYVFICHSPCEELRQEFAQLFSEDAALNTKMTAIEGKASRAAGETDEAAKKMLGDAVAADAARLRSALVQAKAEIERTEKAMADLIARSPELQKAGLDAAALRRTLAKGTEVDGIKGLLQEEIYARKVAGMTQEDLAKMANPNVQASLQGKKLEFIEGRRLRMNGEEVTDGIIGYYNEKDEFVIVDVIESKAGARARKDLASDYESAKPKQVKLPDGTVTTQIPDTYTEMQKIVAESMRKSDPTLKGMTLDEIISKHKDDIDAVIQSAISQSEAGQVRRDLERLVENESGAPTVLTLDNTKALPVRAYPSQTKVTAVYPNDVRPGRMEKNISNNINAGLAPGQDGGLPFKISTDKSGYTQKELEEMAGQIRQAAETVKSQPAVAP